MDELPWKLLETYIKDHPNYLVKHHIDSYNAFWLEQLPEYLREKNPIQILKEPNETNTDYLLKAKLYIGGKEGDKVYIGKPMIYDDENVHFMYPNEARLRNMTYGFSIHVDVLVEYTIQQEGETVEHTNNLEKILLGRFPIMLQSKLCVLHGLDRKLREQMGECKNDPGGYFIISGKEKVIVPQEKFGDNMIYVKDDFNEKYSHSAEIRSVSENMAKPIRTTAVRLVRPIPRSSNNNIVVQIANIRKPIPLFIVMRALGIISDKAIMELCLLNNNDTLKEMLIPCVHDAGMIFTKETALEYMAGFTKQKTVQQVLLLLSDYFLAHIGENLFYQKACFLGYMVYKMLQVVTNSSPATDRDHFMYKRIETSGHSIGQLFHEYYLLQQKHIFTKIDENYLFHKGEYQENFTNLIDNNYQDYFKDRIVEEGFRKAFKGNWGATPQSKKIGIVQPLNRLSFNSALSHLRKLNLPLDSSAKVIGPRLLHASQWGIIDPHDSPDGGNIGLHKHLAIFTHITSGEYSKQMISKIRSMGMKFLEECTRVYLANATKIFINGNWIGVANNPKEIMAELLQQRRTGQINPYNSISWNISENCIYIFTDEGRPCRPIYYINNEINKISYQDSSVYDDLIQNNASWKECLFGKSGQQSGGVIEYMDAMAAENSYIALKKDQVISDSKFTHLEIHPSFMFGVMGNQAVFPEHNPGVRDCYFTGQAKQGISLYHSNFDSRIDKMGVVLEYGQNPLIQSKYTKYIHNNEHPYGVNAIVAIMAYTGYNVEDAIIFNQSAVDRGLFNMTYYSSYEGYEGTGEEKESDTVTHQFANVNSMNATIKNIKSGYDYDKLDDNGLIRENVQLTEKMVVIGKVSYDMNNPGEALDESIATKKGQMGFIDKTFMTENKEGHRLAKIRIREERKPSIGDKFCSRCGQKGTVGTILQEKDMPFTADGIRPDIIINPHAIPSRMTIGQLIETVYGKACTGYGLHGDCTAYNHDGDMAAVFGSILEELGYHSSGCEILHDGATGDALESNIFIGPTYYLRLKQMVKDKINYRARGPVSNLTRQTVQGRANDGGLRIGEMERDGLIANGMSYFVNDSLMNRGDEFFIAVCNQSGMLAFYNEKKNMFFSPMIDGPIQFTNSVSDSMRVNPITRYGRTFSIVRVPYAFKLLMQELGTMNIQLRLITSDTIQHLTSLKYSNNIQKLLHTKSRIPEVIDHIMNGTPLKDLTVPAPARAVTQLPTSVIPGGYNINDIVYSKVDYRGIIKPGFKGTVKGPCDDATLEDANMRVNVAFDSGITTNMLYSHISKKNPNPQLGPPQLATTAQPPLPPPATPPATSPATSPATPPPATPDTATEVSVEGSFKEGDAVELIQDTRQDRIWTIDGVDGEDIMISTEDFKEGEEGWQLVTKEEIRRVNTGLKIGEDVTLQPDPLPTNIVEEVIPLATLQDTKKEEVKKDQEAATPTLFQQEVKADETTTKEEKQDEQGGGGIKEITI